MMFRFLSVLLISPLMFSCTLYQSEGREALEKNKNNIIGPLHVTNAIELTCYDTPLPPSELTGPVHVLETDYEGQGYSSYLVRQQSSSHVLVYEAPQEPVDQHRFCRMKLLKGESKSYIDEAVDFGVYYLLDL